MLCTTLRQFVTVGRKALAGPIHLSSWKQQSEKILLQKISIKVSPNPAPWNVLPSFFADFRLGTAARQKEKSLVPREITICYPYSFRPTAIPGPPCWRVYVRGDYRDVSKGRLSISERPWVRDRRSGNQSPRKLKSEKSCMTTLMLMPNLKITLCHAITLIPLYSSLALITYKHIYYILRTMICEKELESMFLLKH